MAPRRGPSRMDAAVDAMIPFGFSKELVRTTMTKLLKVYGGDAGWAFIEADAYKVLLEEILAGEEEARKQAESSMKVIDRNLTEVDSAQDDRVGDQLILATVGPSRSIESAGSLTPNTACRGDGNRWKDIALDKTCSPETTGEAPDPMYCPIAPGPFPQPLNVVPPAPPSIPAQRRPPCYGWIDDDDDEGEETEFVLLTPSIIASASPPRAEQMESLGNPTVKTPKRRSRWDLKPEDM